MSGCCSLPRRQALSWGALVAATPLLGAAVDPDRAYALVRGGSTAPVVPMDLELVTLTEDERGRHLVHRSRRRDRRVRPAGAGAQRYRGAAGHEPEHAPDGPARHPADAVPLRRADRAGAGTDVLLRGALGRDSGGAEHLRPRRPGRHERPKTAIGAPFVFTTPHPPPGRHLFTVALSLDAPSDPR